MKRITLMALLTVVGAGLCIPPRADEGPEPKYEGKPLHFWVKKLQGSDSDVQRRVVLDAIKAFGADAAPAVPALVELLDDRSEAYRADIAQLLCDLGPPAKGAAPFLVRLLKEKKARSPELVVKVLGRIAPDVPEVVPVLVAGLQDRQLRSAALEALCSLGSSARGAIPALRDAIRAAKADAPAEGIASPAVVFTLAKLGVDAIPLLIELLDEPDSMFPRRVAQVLGEIGPAAKPAVPALTKALQNDDPFVRRDAACALWQIDKNSAGVPVLAAMVKDGGSWLVEPAAAALGEIGPAAKAALPELERAYYAHPRSASALTLAIGRIDAEAAKKLRKVQPAAQPAPR